MLKLNHGRTRRLAGLTLAGAVAIGAIATASAAQEKADGETKKFEKRIVIHHAGDKDVLKRGDPGELRNMAMDCPGEVFQVDSTGGTGERKEDVKFVICTQGDKMLSALEKAEADIQKSDDMPADRKNEILTKVRAKIAELRARG